MNFSLFFLLFLGGMAVLNYYVYKRFLHKLHPPFNAYAFVIPSVLMVTEILFVLQVLYRLWEDSPTLYYLLSASIGVTFLLFVIALVYDLNLLTFKHVPFEQSRRKFIKIVFDTTMLILAISYLFKGLKGGLSDPILNTVHVGIPDVSSSDYVIIQLSDVHIGKTLKKSFVQQLVKRVNTEHPNMVVITGDLVDHTISEIKEDLAPLQEIQAPCYFILGNHEYFHNATEAIEHMRTLGIQVLLNEHVQIHDGEYHFNLVGLTDVIGERIGEYPMDIAKAYKGLDETLPTLVLAHQPKTILRLSKRRCDLMLSGHTHGGQIFPFGLLVMIDQPYLAGLYRHNDAQQIFVSRGTGYWGPPIRVMAPSEISKIVIQATS